MSKKGSAALGLNANEVAPRPPPSLSKNNYKINWLSCTILLGSLFAFAASLIYGIPLHSSTLKLAIVWYFLNGFGITAGYHRMFSHRAFSGTPTLEWIMLFLGAGAFQGSCKWWGRLHRIHHRYIDTDKDPYNANRGFFYSHLGWMLMQQDMEILGRVDVDDFKQSKAVMLQHNFYLPIAMVSGVILPTLIAGLGWGDWVGGYFYAAIGKMVFVHHSTFFINSLAHTSFFSAQNFSHNHTSQDSLLCAVLTLGEGYHNFHHEFPNDYRNGIKWYHYDPTKWLIRSLEYLGVAFKLNRSPNKVIKQNYLRTHSDTHRKQLDKFQNQLQQVTETVTGTTPLPKMTMDDLKSKCAAGEKLIVIDGMVYDMLKKVPSGAGYTHKNKNINWHAEHPGGEKLLDMFVGKDASSAFHGSIYKHSLAANNLLIHLRVAEVA